MGGPYDDNSNDIDRFNDVDPRGHQHEPNDQSLTMGDHTMRQKTNKITIQVCKWHDRITNESAEQGDYEETGCDWLDYRFDNMRDAVDQYVSDYNDHCWDSHDGYVNEVMYDVDGDQDLHDGSWTHERLVINVDSDDTIKTERQRRIEAALEYMIGKRIA